jgi:hypothetical protein
MPTFPASRAEFFFNADTGKVPHEFVVVDQPTRFKNGVVDEKNLANYYDGFNQSLGAHCGGWMETDGPHDTPEGVFATEFLDRSGDRDVIFAALQEFGKIEECEMGAATV